MSLAKTYAALVIAAAATSHAAMDTVKRRQEETDPPEPSLAKSSSASPENWSLLVESYGRWQAAIIATVTKADLTAARPDIFGRCRGMFEHQEGWDAPEDRAWRQVEALVR